MRKLVILSALVGAAAPAYALNQSVHYQISHDSCIAAGAPDAFCELTAVAAHNVDDYEFNTLSAHSQMEVGQTACDGANAAIWRVFWFGQQIRFGAETVAINPNQQTISSLASNLGRALHTIQDNCAHAGMPNPEHAWKSLDDVCHGTHESPDLVPEAAVCAREETDAIMQAVFDVLDDFGAEKQQLSNATSGTNHLTDYMDACNFLGSASSWDGVDRRWDNTVVRPYMRNEIVQAITNDSAQHGWVCDATTDGILIGYEEDVDTSGGANSCVLIHGVCLGKADDVAPAASAPSAVHGGCAMAPTASGVGGVASLVWLAALALLSRRARRASN
jgi:hypothetical protein